MPNTLHEIKYPVIFKEICGSRGDSIYTYVQGNKGTSTNFMFGPRYISSNLYDFSSPEHVSKPIRIFSADDMSMQMTMCTMNKLLELI
ncbi:hypothetical protein MKX03_033469 [Papaver bracteatum]|nr:hypothetical protein MKX03_033469 [Papaver bracteatum]